LGLANFIKIIFLQYSPVLSRQKIHRPPLGLLDDSAYRFQITDPASGLGKQGTCDNNFNDIAIRITLMEKLF